MGIFETIIVSWCIKMVTCTIRSYSNQCVCIFTISFMCLSPACHIPQSCSSIAALTGFLSRTWSPSTGTHRPAVCLPTFQLPHQALWSWNPISPQPTTQAPHIAFKTNLPSSFFPSLPCFPHGPCQCSSAPIDYLVAHTSSCCVAFSLFARLSERPLSAESSRVSAGIIGAWVTFDLNLGSHGTCLIFSPEYPLCLLKWNSTTLEG